MEFSKSEVKKFNQAKVACQYSDFDRQHIGAVIFYNNKALTVGWSTVKEFPMQKKYNAFRNFEVDKFINSGHAEMSALNKLCHSFNLNELDTRKLSIYIYRDCKDKKGIAKPCIACEQALKDVGIKSIYYTGNDSYIYEKYI